jgi:plasmid stabilization system protein ParE
MTRFKLTGKAEVDIEEIRAYYAGVASAELADRFFSFLMNKCNLFTKNPELGSLKYSGLFQGRETRCVNLQKFPYIVFYEYQKNEGYVEVIRIFHEKRNFLELI